jgi:predicted transcriptional regulator
LRRLLTWAPFVALFSRVSGPAVLNNKTRELIYLHIQERPGAYYRSIQRDLGLAQGTLTHHLYTLERENLIQRQRHGLRLRFFPTSLGAIRTRPLSPWQLKVMEVVRSNPGISQSDLARILGLTRQALHYHIDQLRRLALIGVTLAGRETNLAVGPEAWSRVGRCQQCATPYLADQRASQLRCGVCSAQITARSAT